MTTSTKTRKATKTVKVLSRIEFNADARKVVYIVRSSNGADTYQTTLFAGKATSCTCPAHKPCYHMTQLETKEAARNLVAQAEEIVSTVAETATPDTDSYEQWKRDNGLDSKLSREEYCQEFSIY